MDSEGATTPLAAALAHIRKVVKLYGLTHTSNLDRQWLGVRTTIIDTVTYTLALGIYTVIASAVLYTVISRKYRDGLATTVLLIVLSSFVTSFTVWLGVVSRLIEAYGVLATEIYSSGDLARSILIQACTDVPNESECKNAYTPSKLDRQPAYTGHGCIGTALTATDHIMHVAVLVGCVAFSHIRQKQFWIRAISIVLLCAPFLAACGSAVKHVRDTCWPDLYSTPTYTPIRGKCGTFNPRALDASTARLLGFARTMATLLVVRDIWETRGAIGRLLRIQTEFWRRLVVVYVPSAAVYIGWRMFRQAYATEWPIARPPLKYAMISAGDALLIPFMNMYPGLVILVQRVRSSDSESEKPEPADVERPKGLEPVSDLPLEEKGLPGPR
ncbi:hypothetical protein BC628DRAFT_750144 [Trametes gibbosa]|nr:hypothetical protein BC628DRAFT_750144 [Trametes gibbosa]